MKKEITVCNVCNNLCNTDEYKFPKEVDLCSKNCLTQYMMNLMSTISDLTQMAENLKQEIQRKNDEANHYLSKIHDIKKEFD